MNQENNLPKITKNNINFIYEYFNKNLNKKTPLNTNEKANLFIQMIINNKENYIHPKKNVLITKNFGEIKVNKNKLNPIKKYLNQNNYTPEEKENLTALIDRLIEDETRKRKGEFFTPTFWVNEAVNTISKTLGNNWKEKYVVWDCAYGTGNLTRDYKFKKLFCSTIEQSDIDTANQMKYNPHAIKFKFDFLNDNNEKLKLIAPELYDMIYNWNKYENEYKGILFFINPPYGTAAEYKTKNKDKKNIAITKINVQMKNEGWGSPSQQLYAQFIYRITQIQKVNKNVKLTLFSPPLFLSGNSYKKFREKFFENFSFVNGFLINANNFADVKDWGLTFSVFNNKKAENYNDFKFVVKSIEENFLLKHKEKIIYNTDNKVNLKSWGKPKKITNNNKIETITLLSPLKIGKITKKYNENTLSFLVNDSNNVMANNQRVTIINTPIPRNHGITQITKENFKKTMIIFASRRLISGKYANWINWYDEYLAPTKEIQNLPEYKQFNDDAIIYALFNNKSNQSSIRNVNLNGKYYNVKNEFFWLSVNEMKSLAIKYNFMELYKDTELYNENKFVYNLLNNNDVNLSPNLSPQAKELLNLSKELIYKSFEFRKNMHENFPYYHLNTWDAGWYQIKKILKIYLKKDYELFVEKYKEFENILRPKVYEFKLIL